MEGLTEDELKTKLVDIVQAAQSEVFGKFLRKSQQQDLEKESESGSGLQSATTELDPSTMFDDTHLFNRYPTLDELFSPETSGQHWTVPPDDLLFPPSDLFATDSGYDSLTRQCPDNEAETRNRTATQSGEGSPPNFVSGVVTKAWEEGGE